MKELIEDTIKRLDLYKPEVVELLLGTCAQGKRFWKIQAAVRWRSGFRYLSM